MTVPFCVPSSSGLKTLLLHILTRIWLVVGVLDVVGILDVGHSNRFVVVLHYCFNSHFPSGTWHGASLATHSSMLAWKISQTEEPGGLQSMGSQRVGHSRAANAQWHMRCTIFSFVDLPSVWQMVRCLLRFLAHFLIEWFVFLLLSFKGFWYILDGICLSDVFHKCWFPVHNSSIILLTLSVTEVLTS